MRHSAHPGTTVCMYQYSDEPDKAKIAVLLRFNPSYLYANNTLLS